MSDKGMSGDSDISRIKRLKDEHDYWASIAAKVDLDPSISDRAHLFAEKLNPISAGFASITEKSFSDVLELLDVSQDCLDGLWRLSHFAVYPEPRMEHVLKLIGEGLLEYLNTKINSMSIWADSFPVVRDNFRKAIQIGEKWGTVCETLTGSFWTSFEKHHWQGGKYLDSNLKTFTERLDEVISIRTVHEQLSRLLSNEEVKELRAEQTFTPFKEINCLDTTAEGLANWKNAFKVYERSMSPIEQRVAGKQTKPLSAV
jgi:dynein heavy chain 2